MNLINILTYNPNLFDGIILPSGLSQEDVVNEILQECATMEPLYGDPDLFHQMILHWFVTRNYTFQKLYDTMHLDYNPLENAYRTETRETGYTRDYSRDASRDGSETEDTGSTQKTVSETTASSKDQVAPYNDDNFHDTTQTTGNNTANGNVENSGNRELNTKNSETISDNENGKTVDNFTLKGSIGLITPQQMIEQERDVVKFNLYQYIAMEFSMRFMIQVY